MQELIRWITLSQAYGLSSRATEGNHADDPSLGEMPKFSHFYLRQMRAEELYESLITATQAAKAKGSYEQQERAKAEWMAQFVTAFGNDEGEEATTFNGTIPQALMMFNGDLIKEAVSLEQNSFLWNLSSSDMPPGKKINYLFRAGLARDATEDEVAIANKLLVVHRGDPSKALQDVWWAVLNTNEFILNH
jgi:glucan biosynthesis protein